MAVVIYTETENESFKKVAFEIASYGKALADQVGQKLVAVTFNQEDGSALGTYGVDEVVNITGAFTSSFSAKKIRSCTRSSCFGKRSFLSRCKLKCEQQIFSSFISC